MSIIACNDWTDKDSFLSLIDAKIQSVEFFASLIFNSDIKKADLKQSPLGNGIVCVLITGT